MANTNTPKGGSGGARRSQPTGPSIHSDGSRDLRVRTRPSLIAFMPAAAGIMLLVALIAWIASSALGGKEVLAANSSASAKPSSTGPASAKTPSTGPAFNPAKHPVHPPNEKTASSPFTGWLALILNLLALGGIGFLILQSLAGKRKSQQPVGFAGPHGENAPPLSQKELEEFNRNARGLREAMTAATRLGEGSKGVISQAQELLTSVRDFDDSLAERQKAYDYFLDQSHQISEQINPLADQYSNLLAQAKVLEGNLTSAAGMVETVAGESKRQTEALNVAVQQDNGVWGGLPPGRERFDLARQYLINALKGLEEEEPRTMRSLLSWTDELAQLGEEMRAETFILDRQLGRLASLLYTPLQVAHAPLLLRAEALSSLTALEREMALYQRHLIGIARDRYKLEPIVPLVERDLYTPQMHEMALAPIKTSDESLNQRIQQVFSIGYRLDGNVVQKARVTFYVSMSGVSPAPRPPQPVAPAATVTPPSGRVLTVTTPMPDAPQEPRTTAAPPVPDPEPVIAAPAPEPVIAAPGADDVVNEVEVDAPAAAPAPEPVIAAPAPEPVIAAPGADDIVNEVEVDAPAAAPPADLPHPPPEDAPVHSSPNLGETKRIPLSEREKVKGGSIS